MTEVVRPTACRAGEDGWELAAAVAADLAEITRGVRLGDGSRLLGDNNESFACISHVMFTRTHGGVH